MILPILKYGSPILRKYSKKLTSEDIPVQIIENLFETLKKAGGIGLAGPQVGILKRVFVIDTSPLIENDISICKYEKAFINPEIIWRSNETGINKEGCLSIPEIFEEVVRPLKIKVRYQDTKFNSIKEEFDGLIARIFQHEYDHLQGILFIDKISSFKRMLLSGKLNEIKKM
jgi:peptide deformylase